jgi:uncharacterized OsmC-like protein
LDLISISHKGGQKFHIRVRGHDVPSDMSEKDGGQDGGPSPVELLAGSLGACIAMMTQRYCDRHGYKKGEVGVSMTIELADEPKRIGRVVVDLEIPEDVPEDRRAAILRMAKACPVHATLKDPPEMDIEIA